jgi:uncharacterized phiE125 gp8 family phage protein
MTLPTTWTYALPWDYGVQWRSDVVSTDTTFLAISVDFAKAVLSVVRDDQDDLIEHYIKAATAFGERYRGEHITPKVMSYTLSGFPTGAIEIADGPIREITGVSYLDDDGDANDYDAVSPHTWIFEPGGRHRSARLSSIYGEAWPTPATRANAVTVTFSVGYETPDDIPADIKQAIAVTVGEFYKNPDLSNSDGMSANILSLQQFWPRKWSNAL